MNDIVINVSITVMWESTQSHSWAHIKTKLPLFPEEYISETILLMGLNVKLNKQYLTSQIISTHHVSPWLFYSTPHAYAHKRGRRGVYDGLQWRKASRGHRTSYIQHSTNQPVQATTLLYARGWTFWPEKRINDPISNTKWVNKTILSCLMRYMPPYFPLNLK